MSFVSKLPAKYVWWLERERVAICEYGKNEHIDCMTSPTAQSNGKKIRMLLTRRALDFEADMSTQSELPPQFHEALAYKAISMGYTRGTSTNVQMAQYFEALYRQTVRDAKKYAGKRHQSTGFIKPVDF